jgi:hypothetical protein
MALTDLALLFMRPFLRVILGLPCARLAMVVRS